MKVELIEDPDLVARMGYAADSARTRDVLHLSDIYKRLMVRLQPKRFTGAPFENNPRVETGILFESILEEALARKFSTVRPGELVSPEGVYMSPDGVNPELGAMEEYKATYMSSRDGIVDEYGMPRQKYLHWFFQILGYAKWLDTRVAMLRVLYLAGDYSKPITPQFRSYRINMTDEDVDQNWAMLMQVAREEGLL